MSVLTRLGTLFGYGPKASASDGGRSRTIEEIVEYMRFGGETSSGVVVTPQTAILNSTVYRAVSIISESIGMLPWSIEERATSRQIENHPLSPVLRRPAPWLTAKAFKSLMMRWVLTEDVGAVAVKVMSRGRVIGLLPVHPSRVTVEQRDDLTLRYEVRRKDGGTAVYDQSEVLHLRAMSEDGVKSTAPARAAREAIGLSSQAATAAARLFKNGMIVGGFLTSPTALSTETKAALRASLESLYTGADNAHRWIIADGGLKPEQRGATAEESQHLEMRKLQIEEIGRYFGVPRPLLGVDETNWGSGVEQLATLFVRFGLSPWFTTWEEEIARSCMTEEEERSIRVVFDEDRLLRGTVKDQAEFFAKALGAGGGRGWLTPNEVREQTGWGPRADGDGLPQGSQQGTPNVTP